MVKGLLSLEALLSSIIMLTALSLLLHAPPPRAGALEFYAYQQRMERATALVEMGAWEPEAMARAVPQVFPASEAYCYHWEWVREGGARDGEGAGGPEGEFAGELGADDAFAPGDSSDECEAAWGGMGASFAQRGGRIVGTVRRGAWTRGGPVWVEMTQFERR